MTSDATLDGVQKIQATALPQAQPVASPVEAIDTAVEEHEVHEHPRGALVLTIFYLLLLVVLWVSVYMQLLSSGGIPRSMNNKYSGYLFELAWILPSIAIPIALLVAIVITAFVVGIGVPGIAGQVDVKNVTHTTPFDTPGVRQVADKQYEAIILAQTFQFTPNAIHVPAGSKVTFILTSKDVIHGFKVDNTPINVMIVPGQVSKVTTTFAKPGEYLYICHEYCGAGHHVMFGKVIVRMSDAPGLPLTSSMRAERAGSLASMWQTIMVLFKLRIVVLLLFAAMGGAFLGAGGIPSAGSLLILLMSGGASAAGASALNQVIERKRDALMRRTKRRPLPMGVLRRPGLIWLIGGGLIVGSVAAVLPFNPMLALFLGLGACIYVGIYTVWLKPRSITNIVIGGLAGSCAVLSGGAAVGHWADPGVLALAGLLFTWTPMHFWSLALIYRDDYAAAGVPMLPVSTSAVRAAWWVLLHGVGTAAIAIQMARLPMLSWLYFVPTRLQRSG